MRSTPRDVELIKALRLYGYNAAADRMEQRRQGQ